MGRHHRVQQADPRRQPARREQRHTRKDAHPEEDDRERGWVEAPAEVEPVRDDRLHHERAREGIQPEQRRQLHHGARGAPDAHETALPLDARELDPRREAQEDPDIH